MNLPLHFGLLGTLEAGVIALLAGLLVFCGWRWLGRRGRMSQGQIIGSAPIKIAIEAGVRFGWDAVIGHDGTFIGMSSFGASGPYKAGLIFPKDILRSAMLWPNCPRG